MVALLEKGHVIDATSLGRSIDMVLADEKPSDVFGTDILRVRGRTIRPKSAGQKKYIEAISENVITFGIGPAGTGKSWLAVAMAVKALQAKQVRRIILTRPAVEAENGLAFFLVTLWLKLTLTFVHFMTLYTT